MIGVIKTPLDAALEIAAGGVPVFPCGANKRPLTPHGFKDATCNDEIISDWWKRWPQANVAIPTGEMSDKVVLDVDMDKAKGKDGENTLAALTAKHGELPKTRQVKTPRGGRHICFRHPGIPIPNNTETKLGKGLDIRGDGGYVLVPPSRTADGVYEEIDDSELADIPPWLLTMMLGRAESAKTPPDEKTDVAVIKAALAYISANCDHDSWVRIGMALHTWDPVAGFEVWEEWSQTGVEKYTEGETAKRWKSFHETANGVTLGTLFDIAKKNGWDSGRDFFGKSQGKEPPRDRTRLPNPVDASRWIRVLLPQPEQILEQSIDKGTKNVIVAPSKGRKSFFLLQMGLCLAAAKPSFLDWSIPAPRRVLLVQFEIKPAAFQHRLTRMMHALDIHPDDLADRLQIINARGTKLGLHIFAQVTELALKHKSDVIIFDPVYKVMPGDENKAEDVKPLLEMFDQLCEQTDAAVLYTCHTAKGMAGDRQAIDRIVGSGVIARDYDCQIGLVEHVEEGLKVCEQICRSYPPKDPFTLTWNDDKGCFEVVDRTPIVRTSSNRNRSGQMKTLTEEDALTVVAEKPLPAMLFMNRLRERGFTARAAEAMRYQLQEAGKLATFREPRFNPTTYYGLTDQIQRMRDQWRNPELRGVSVKSGNGA